MEHLTKETDVVSQGTYLAVDLAVGEPSPPYEPFEPNDRAARSAELPPTPPSSSREGPAFLCRLNIVIQVVGSRGDVQPFIALGTALQKHGHRVRIATHDIFETFVTSTGLEFFPVGGDPAELMAYMVSSPRLVPDMAQLRAGAISRKRAMYARMLEGFWESCLAPDRISGIPFVADAIIANPPSYAHVHCAEALGVPCHLVFTMPWTSTRAFPQPLAGLRIVLKEDGQGSGSVSTRNQMSYAAVNFLTWQGLGDIVNHWRVSALDLEAVPATEGPHLIESLQVPFTYCWSPSLVHKPSDWGNHIDVCGFFFREPPSYTPPKDLEAFLLDGTPPVYIGFGSIVVGDGAGLMAMVLSAVRAAGVRAIISRGWSNLEGADEEDIFFIGDCPHEWLFQQVAAVVHHGGAGTTACGLRYGRPTAIVPFFGDQGFWGEVIHKVGAGPAPLPYESVISQKLAQALRVCLSDEAREAAGALARKMASEDGVSTAVESFHRNLQRERISCDFYPEETAVWAYGRGKKEIKMCRGVSAVLRRNGEDLKDLRLLKIGDIAIENRRWDPITAISAASLSTVAGVADAAADVIRKPIEQYRKQQQQHGPAKGIVGTGQQHKISTAIPSGAAMLPLADMKSIPDLDTDLQTGGNSTHSSTHSTAKAMAGASAQSAAKAVARSTRGVLVDIPLAATEGMRAVPQLWGEQVEQHKQIEDFHSGVHVAGRSFISGVTGAVKGIFVRTYEGKRDKGAMGAIKGLGQGTVGLATKTTAAVVGLAAYPAQGASKSIRATMRGETRRRITRARWREAEWLLQSGSWTRDERSILEDFEGLKGRRRG